MNPQFYLMLAQKHLECVRNAEGLVSPRGVAECRSAISRAYYAAYLRAVDLLNHIGIAVTEKGDCHNAVRHGLIESKDELLARAGSRLGTLATVRKRADYRFQDTDVEQLENAEAYVELAFETVKLLDQFRAACDRDKAKGKATSAAILAWAKQVQSPHLYKK